MKICSIKQDKLQSGEGCRTGEGCRAKVKVAEQVKVAEPRVRNITQIAPP
jgi:hypothetical protein